MGSLAVGTPGTTNYALVRAADTVASQANLNPDFDCDDATLLNKKLIQGKILICTFSGMIDGLNPSISSRIAAKATGAVGLVLVDGRVFLETYSPGSLNFLNFPSIMINGKTAQVVYPPARFCFHSFFLSSNSLNACDYACFSDMFILYM